MKNKYYNDAIIGNKKIIASYTEKGELQRLCYPEVDGRQFIDYFQTGVKINDSNLIYLHQDINNKYSQEYIENTNILKTNIKNTYFNFNIEQIDFALVDKNIIVKKYIFKNNNSVDLDTKFIINSKILSNDLERFGSRIVDKGIIQYNHNYAMAIFSNKNLYGHKLNDVQRTLQSAVIMDKDYIGMSNEIAISYDIGVIHPGEQQELNIFILVNENHDIEEKIQKCVKLNTDIEFENVKNYWNLYVENHSKIKIESNKSDFYKKLLEIYNRTILLFPLLINDETGGIVAALELDENRTKSGCYAYCWPRDSIFITRAFDLLKMEEETEKFYNVFCKKTQSNNGMWEQRFYTDGTLAPCWGYQIDETASVIYGVYDHYKHTKDNKFLEENLKMCEKATEFLFAYTENLLNIDEEDLVKKELQEKYKKYFEITKHVSYDLWEMNEGVHLYSLSSIISGLECMKKIYETIDNKQENLRLKQEKRNKIALKLNKYIQLLKDYIEDNLIDKNTKTLKRNLKDNNMDISVIGAVYPFNVFNPNEKVIKNTVDKINMTLRTHTSGYLRFEYDNYMGGNNPWIITTLWMALYYIKINDLDNAKKCFSFVVNTSLRHGFLAEQVNNDDKNFKWVIGLGWSHAMFIIVLNELLKANEGKNN
ncbi:MAG TPA: glycoside hydrolase family 15 protein [Clostridiaceae bacterium]|nr:glycoside hydrolase family 15 protein [Clostridiaceae bacterium]